MMIMILSNSLHNTDSLFSHREIIWRHIKVFFFLLLKKEHNECESSGWQLFSEAYTELIGPVLCLMYINNLDPWVNSDLLNLGEVHPKV